MTYTIVGLGNPDEKYFGTRHNAGRFFAQEFARKHKEDFSFDKKAEAHKATVKIGKDSAKIILPDTYMNKSGKSVGYFVKSAKAAERLVVIYDDLDLPIGRVKMSFGKGSGGHKGVESVARALKTKNFIRIRIGVSPATPSGKIKKVHGATAVEKHILGSFSKKEQGILDKLVPSINDALNTLMSESFEKAMQALNTK